MSEMQTGTQAATKGTTAEPVQIHGGDALSTWDDLDPVGPMGSGDATVIKTEQKEDKKETKKKETKKQDDSEEEEEEESKELKDSEGTKDADQTDQKEDKKDLDSAIDKIKRLTVKDGEQELTISRDALIPVKVDGKNETVNIQELINNYSGKTNWDRQYSKLNTERKAFESERNSLQTAVNDIHRLVTEDKNPRAVMEYIAEAMGSDPIELWRNIELQVSEKLKEVEDLTEEERRVKNLEEEIEYRNKKESIARTKQAEAQLQQEVQAKVARVQEQYGMDDDKFVEVYDKMIASGHFDAETIEPEQVGKIYADMQTQQRVVSVVETSLQELDEQTKSKAISDLFAVALREPDLSEKDLKQIAIEVYGSESTKRLSQKIKKMNKKSEQVVRNPTKDPVFFEDMYDD